VLTLPLDAATADAMIAAHREGTEMLRARVTALWASEQARAAWVDKVRGGGGVKRRSNGG
jgi:hypothetical protein